MLKVKQACLRRVLNSFHSHLHQQLLGQKERFVNQLLLPISIPRDLTNRKTYCSREAQARMKCEFLIGSLGILSQTLATFLKLLYVVLKQTIRTCFALVLLTHAFAYLIWLPRLQTKTHSRKFQIANHSHNFPNADSLISAVFFNSYRIT